MRSVFTLPQSFGWLIRSRRVGIGRLLSAGVKPYNGTFICRQQCVGLMVSGFKLWVLCFLNCLFKALISDLRVPKFIKVAVLVSILTSIMLYWYQTFKKASPPTPFTIILYMSTKHPSLFFHYYTR